MKRFILPILIALTLILAACTPTKAGSDPATSSPAPVSGVTSTPTDDPALLPTLLPNIEDNEELVRIDEQGAVVVEVTPLNLSTAADTLEFNVSMNTHSVDLSMDLAMIATLTTDTGVSVQASTWDAPQGGHHVEGKLVFPAMSDGKSIIQGVSRLTLTLVGVDAASRVFEWQLK